MSRRAILLSLLSLLAVGAALLAGDWWICLPADEQAHYVGSEQCARCHQKEMELWKGSDHDLAMQLATPETVLGNFDNQRFTHVAFKQLIRLSDEDLRTVLQNTQHAPWAVALHDVAGPVKEKLLAAMPQERSAQLKAEADKLVVVRPCDAITARDKILRAVNRLRNEERIRTDFALTSRLFREGDKFFVTTDGPGGERETFEIKYTFGYWPLQQYLIEFPDGRVQCLGIAFNTKENYWFHLYPNEIIPPGDELHWTRRSQNWNHMCAECHSTNLEKGYDLAANTFDTTWSEIDVSCETCHGPGSLHVKLAESNRLCWDRRHGYGLPRLKDVDSRVEVETCAPCHARRRVVYPNHRDGVPLPAGPGQKLLDYHLPELFDRHYYYPDGQVLDEDYVYSSFIQSKMHQKGVRCSDCHDPHSLRVKSTDGHAPRGEPIDNSLCTGCHTNQHPKGKYDTPAHHFHPDSSQGGTRCVECHMPETTYMVCDPRRDHSIRVPRPDLTVKLGVPNACNLCHNDKSKGETAEWAAAKIEEWYGKKNEPPHFALAVAAGREGKPEGERALQKLFARKSITPAVRATAVLLLAPYQTPAGLQASRRGLKDPDELVRAAAARSFHALLAPALQHARLSAAMRDPLEAVPLLRECYRDLAPMLADPVRTVRTEAAWVLTYFPPQAVLEEDRPAFDDALAEYLAGQQSLADQPTAHMNMGIVYANLGRHDKAEQEYLAAIRLDPAFPQARINLAMLYGQQGNGAKAERQFRGAIALLKKMSDDAVEQMRDPAGARRLLAEVYYSLGLLLAEDEGNLERACEELGEAVRLSADDARMHYNYGLSLQKLARPAEAEQQFIAACKLQPDAPDYLNALMILHTQQEHWAGAIEAAGKLLQLQPQNRQLRAMLQRLKQAAAQAQRGEDSPPQ